MSDDPSLEDAPRLTELLGLLPASTETMAEQMDVAETTIQSYRDRLQNTHDVDLTYDRDANQWFLTDERSTRLRALSTTSKQAVTREVTERIEDENHTLIRRLRLPDPL